jgi:hypothetical protein
VTYVRISYGRKAASQDPPWRRRALEGGHWRTTIASGCRAPHHGGCHVLSEQRRVSSHRPSRFGRTGESGVRYCGEPGRDPRRFSAQARCLGDRPLDQMLGLDQFRRRPPLQETAAASGGERVDARRLSPEVGAPRRLPHGLRGVLSRMFRAKTSGAGCARAPKADEVGALTTESAGRRATGARRRERRARTSGGARPAISLWRMTLVIRGSLQLSLTD